MERLINKGKQLAREAREILAPALQFYEGSSWEELLSEKQTFYGATDKRVARYKEIIHLSRRWIPKTSTVPTVSSSFARWAMRLTLPTEDMALLDLLDWEDFSVDTVQKDIKDYAGPDKPILDFLIDSIRERTADGVVAPYYGRSKGLIVRYYEGMGERFPLRWFLYQRELFDLMTEVLED